VPDRVAELRHPPPQITVRVDAGRYRDGRFSIATPAAVNAVLDWVGVYCGC
jgi:hypothetical protein